MKFSKRLIQFAQKNEFLTDWNKLDDKWHLFSLSSGEKSFKAAIKWTCDPTAQTYALKLSLEQTLLQNYDKAYLEAFCQLSQSLSLIKINLISARDLESFLRDENHIPSLPIEIEHNVEAIKWLDTIKKELVKPLYRQLFDSIFMNIENLRASKSFLMAIKELNSMINRQKRLGASVCSSEIIAVIPMDDQSSQYELQWRFASDIESENAQALCLALEESLRFHGITGKVVAES